MPERKPLELTVYPKGVDPHGTPVYLDGGELGYREDDCDWLSELKRPTDAELAAEAFREKSMMLAFRLHAEKSKGQGGKDLWTRSADEAEQRLHVLHRFATHDHFDQEDQ